jgi:hypothetical protein
VVTHPAIEKDWLYSAAVLTLRREARQIIRNIRELRRTSAGTTGGERHSQPVPQNHQNRQNRLSRPRAALVPSVLKVSMVLWTSVEAFPAAQIGLRPEKVVRAGRARYSEPATLRRISPKQIISLLLPTAGAQH